MASLQLPDRLLDDLEAERAHQQDLGVPGTIVVSIDVDGRGRIGAWEFGGKRRRTLPREERSSE